MADFSWNRAFANLNANEMVQIFKKTIITSFLMILLSAAIKILGSTTK